MSSKLAQFSNFGGNNKDYTNKINSNIAIVYHLILHIQQMPVYLSCSDVISAPVICCKARLVTTDFNFACLHPKYTMIVVTISMQ